MEKLARGILFSVLLVTAVVGSRLSTADAQQSADVSTHPWIGNVAPAFALREVGGGELRLEDLRGKYVVIHFGASW